MMIERFIPRLLGPKPWGEEVLVAETSAYTGKVLRMRAGHRGGFQRHHVKDETFHLVSGLALISSVTEGEGVVTSVIMHPGESYHVPPGAIHQVEALEDCVLFEASTPAPPEDRENMSTAYARGLSGEAG